FFGFLEEARSISQRKIHIEDLVVTQNGKDIGPETETRIVVSKKIGITGNTRVLLFIELGPEIKHLDIDEIQRQCRSPGIDIPRINMVLTENKIVIKENLHVLQFLKKNITATEVSFFTNNGEKPLEKTKMTLGVWEMESIVFGSKGVSVLSSITNEKIDVRHMAVMDIVGFFEKEKEETKKKEFVIRERLYMRNTGIFFLECLGNTAFIPVIKIEVDCCMEYLGGFEETIGIHVETNVLVEKIDPQIKQKIGGMIAQKKIVVKNEFGYQKVVFEEDSKHGEQSESKKSNEQPITGCQELEEFKEYCKYEELRETEKPSEKPSMGSQTFKEEYSLLEESADMHIPEENYFLQDEDIVDPFWNLFLEGRG
ncbi:MAG: uncharacterized protein A8A55_2871, partial [Amphiamblys sp. WSBS2006]